MEIKAHCSELSRVGGRGAVSGMDCTRPAVSTPSARGRRRRSTSWLALLAFVAWASLSPAAPAPLGFGGETMGTTYSVAVPAPQQPGAELEARVAAELAAVNASMSTYLPQSELSRFNDSRDTTWHIISPELMTVLAAAARVSRETDGAFDATVGPVVNLWGFGPEQRLPIPPAADALSAARQRIGYRLLELRDAPPRLRKSRDDVYVDLSAIAKGHAVDRVAAVLEATGHTAYMIEVGGELRVRGARADGQPWRVGVAWPESGRDDVERVLALRDTALATSGDYRRYFEFEGRRYAHEIDPATGEPVHHALASVTVLHASAMLADAYATGLLVLGPERGPALARALGLAALFLVRDGTGLRAIRTGDFPRGDGPPAASAGGAEHEPYDEGHDRDENHRADEAGDDEHASGAALEVALPVAVALYAEKGREYALRDL